MPFNRNDEEFLEIDMNKKTIKGKCKKKNLKKQMETLRGVFEDG